MSLSPQRERDSRGRSVRHRVPAATGVPEQLAYMAYGERRDSSLSPQVPHPLSLSSAPRLFPNLPLSLSPRKPRSHAPLRTHLVAQKYSSGRHDPPSEAPAFLKAPPGYPAALVEPSHRMQYCTAASDFLGLDFGGGFEGAALSSLGDPPNLSTALSPKKVGLRVDCMAHWNAWQAPTQSRERDNSAAVEH